MPPETESEARTSAPRVWAPPEPHLFLVLEGERPAGGGLRCALRGLDEVRIGRGDERTVNRDVAAKRASIAVADRKISATHARVVRTGETWRLEDTGSTNGSFVNGVRITSQALADGDIVSIGRTVFRFRSALPTPSGTAEVVTSGDDRTATIGLETLVPALAGEIGVVGRASASHVPILLLGETGSGKEVVAHAIHAASGRRGSFVAVNCAALPEALIESQLFGHVKGAFSGATRDELGFVRSAQGGTLFLDEIGDLRRAAQGVLLRVLQEGEVIPVGASKPLQVDVRVVAATHRPLDAMIARGEFRADLFARLQGFTHRLWPLRERREDIGLLIAAHLAPLPPAERAAVKITTDALVALLQHDWPLNVRELVQCISRARAVATGGHIEREHFGAMLAASTDAVIGGGAEAEASGDEVDEALRSALIGHLRDCRGNVAAVSRQMNKAPMQVYRWMRRLGLDPKRYR